MVLSFYDSDYHARYVALLCTGGQVAHSLSEGQLDSGFKSLSLTDDDSHDSTDN